MVKRAVLFLLLGLPAAVSAAAMHVNGLDSKVARITFEQSFLQDVPERGVIPLEFQIRNLMKKPGRWTFRFSATQGWRNQKRMSSTQSVDVDALSSKTVRWQIPVFPNTEFGSGESLELQVEVSGPGTSGGFMTHLLNGSPATSGNESPLIAFSGDLILARDQWNYPEFKDQHTGRNGPLRVTTFTPAMFPVTSTGLSGVDALVMSQPVWENLAASRPLIRKWIAGGGRVLVVRENPGKTERIGLGEYREIGFISPHALNRALAAHPFMTQGMKNPRAFGRRTWRLADEIQEIRPSFFWVMLAVIVIAALLGPVNIWFCFRRRKSLQVIWMTPVISLTLSLLVALGIVFSDGFGGRGARSLFVLLVPEENLELSVQEQISRTGVLFSTGFELPDATECYMVASGADRSGRSLRYRQPSPNKRDGDWFENRSIQAQVLRRSRTSRADVRLIPGAEPRVFSSVDAGFSRILIRDALGNHWMARGISPGKEMPLRKVSQAEADRFLNELETRQKMHFPRQTVLDSGKGWFFAESMETDRYLDSLPSVDWHDRPVMYFGPLSREGGR